MPTKIVVPELGESVVEATVGHWKRNQGDRVAVGDVLVELETEKVDLEVGAERGGVLTRIERKEGEDVKIGDLLGVIEDAPAEGKATAKGGEAKPAEKEEPVETGTQQATVAVAAEAQEAAPKKTATPLARRIAEEHGIDLSRIQPSDSGGRIRQRDVESFLQSQTPSAEAAQEPSGKPATVQPTPQIVPGASAPRAWRPSGSTAPRGRLSATSTARSG